jgi:hypothetical protein
MVAVRVEVDPDTGMRLELLDQGAQRRQHVAATLPGLPAQGDDVAAQLGDAGIGHGDEVGDICMQGIVGVGLALQGLEPHAQPDIGLHGAVVQVARDAPALAGGGGCSEAVHQAQVVQAQGDLHRELMQEGVAHGRAEAPVETEADPAGVPPLAHRKGKNTGNDGWPAGRPPRRAGCRRAGSGAALLDVVQVEPRPEQAAGRVAVEAGNQGRGQVEEFAHDSVGHPVDLAVACSDLVQGAVAFVALPAQRQRPGRPRQIGEACRKVEQHARFTQLRPLR